MYEKIKNDIAQEYYVKNYPNDGQRFVAWYLRNIHNLDTFEAKACITDGAGDKQIDAVYSLDDETSIGVLQAIEDAGRTDIKVITGGGGCQEYFKIIKENESINICSALYSPLMVREAVDMAVSVLKGEKVDPVLVIPTTIVDRSNVDEYLDPNNTVY